MTNLRERYVIDAKGKRTGVLLSVKQYEKLMDDLHDLAIVAERRTEKSVTVEELRRRLKKDGLL